MPGSGALHDAVNTGWIDVDRVWNLLAGQSVPKFSEGGWCWR